MESVARGGTRWKRFAVVMVPSVAATAAIGVALSQGALAASFSVSGQQFKVSADKLVGTGMTQYGTVDMGADGKPHPVTVSAFKDAKIHNMCQSVVTKVPVLGDITMVLNAGGKGTPVNAENIYIDIAQLESSKATFSNIDIGIATGKATKGPAPKEPTEGAHRQVDPNGFAQQADGAVIEDVKQTAWATSASTLELSGFGLQLKKGSGKGVECY
ncbi:cholesterol esterase [Streptomyces sp. TRM66268-LWL]|uniref:Cholesterol esterase n=1 Tax=Streptomyces polyasparticus TaxID=2767826 RepID=A0ABR7S7H9_9ACTN|nr:DUF6230 family protein [Streptomyces polyasparticus]MBC9711411.1 cholesterol esterase [Streptomyces polyasparticus]